MKLREDEQGGRIRWTQSGQAYELKYGAAEWILNEGNKNDADMQVAASGCWTDEETFLLTVRPVRLRTDLSMPI
ncbi:hypothetical protein ACFSR7_00095 [Cohnella sp. GCM10020058]|uniref:hypothetical protein n=1 Tax=Cohnella sp. GCM10020058 TaxID=3317330 RepID=UPI0036444855